MILQGHPNAPNTSLALLADVVAKRARCLGPRVDVSSEPAPVIITVKRRRILQIETSAVRDALTMLDRTGGPGMEGVSGEGERKRKRLDERGSDDG